MSNNLTYKNISLKGGSSCAYSTLLNFSNKANPLFGLAFLFSPP